MTDDTVPGRAAPPIELVAPGLDGWGDVRAVIEPSAGGRLASLVVRGVERLVGRPNDGDRFRIPDVSSDAAPCYAEVSPAPLKALWINFC